MDAPLIRELCPSDEAALDAFLLPRMATSMFLLGNMRSSGLIYNGQPYTGTYVAAFENGAIVGVVAHYWNGNLLLQAPVHLRALWRAAVQASQRPIEGLIGPGDQVRAVKVALNLTDAGLKMDQPEELYSLDLNVLKVPEALRTGEVTGRRVEVQDLELLTQWRVGYEIEALGEEDTPLLWEKCRASAERAVEGRDTWILEADGQPVATSAFNTRTKEAVQVGGVWTPPELRCRGYARCVVAQSLLDARDEITATGVREPQAILFTGADNIPAQRVYEALGFRRVGDYYILLLKRPLQPLS
jgi:predicted GNAT family acetyltransferase